MRRAALYLGIVLGLLLAGCSGGQPTAEDILAQSAILRRSTMTEVDSLQFLIERQGSPVEIDTGLATAAFSSAEGGRFSA